ncbi:MAG: hypothetical protein FJ303_26670 [Planctomycetes bacterium]|nr:hypothetical protein [Planctomycetota bacterium]
MWSVAGPVVTGAAVGAGYGSPFFGIGILPGAVIGAVAGLVIGDKYSAATLANETKARVVQFVDHAVQLLNGRKDEAVRTALEFSGFRSGEVGV